jgi:RNA polymerase sigma-70 factor (ECF subfamily)
MATDEFNENDPLEQFLDQESDADFGPAKIHEHLDENSQPLVLRNWKAQDFANIYVRFHPHVLRQAKRYLTNHSQAEEITQDAFLYLMTSLPEVDSETGVLKLLKWKVRLLALDLIKINSQASFAPLDSQPELSIDDSALSLELERADDAAIVALALAKLEPRQREALVASLYEEKTSSQVAAQLGLNENATRQLVFRAKGAFKKALVGEAETRGLTVSEIISVAARKASKDAGKYVSVASALLLVLAVSLGVLPNLASSTVQLNANTPTIASELGSGTGSGSETSAVDSSAASSSTEAEQAEASSAPSLPASADQLASSEPDNTGIYIDPGTSNNESAASAGSTANSSSSSALAPESAASPSSVQLASFANSQASIDQSPFYPWLLDPLFGQEFIETTLLTDSAVVDSSSPALLSVVSNQGLWVDLNFQPSSAMPFQAVTVGLYIDGKQYFARTNQQDLIVLAGDSRTETYFYVGLIGSLTDVAGTRYDNTRLDGGKVQVSVTFDTQTGVVSSTRIALAGRF